MGFSLSGTKKVAGRGEYFPAGADFVLDIDLVKCFQNNDREDRFCVECLVVETDAPGVRKGDRLSFIRDPKGKFGYDAWDIVEWCSTVMEKLHPGTNAADNWRDEYLKYLAQEGSDPTDHPQPARGIRMHTRTRLRKNTGQKEGQKTLHDFWRVMEPGEVLGLVSGPAPVQAPVQGAGAPSFPSKAGIPFDPPTSAAAPAAGGPMSGAKPPWYDESKFGPWRGTG